MLRSLVMTVIGEDRTGLVEFIASIVAEHNGNWMESRMSRLGGYFAGILRIEVPVANEAALSKALGNLASHGLEVVVRSDASKRQCPDAGKVRKVEIVGQDRPGIIRSISLALAKRGVNLEELHSERSSAAMSGETLFRAEATLLLPSGCDVAGLQQDLEQIAADLIVDVRIQEEA